MNMKTIRFLLTLAILLPFFVCNGQNKTTTKPTAKTEKIEVYYFHFTTRCVTCRTLEAEAKKDAETLYPKLAKAGKITFQSINLDDKSSDALARKLKVSGQTLLIVKGNKQINLTNEGFLYCRSDAAKFKAIIKEKMDSLLK
jgi:hypothetical protein